MDAILEPLDETYTPRGPGDEKLLDVQDEASTGEPFARPVRAVFFDMSFVEPTQHGKVV